MTFSYKKVIGWLMIGISLVMIGNSIRLCFSNDIWYDELFTVGMFRHSYGELVRFTARDVHPPLYYCVTKAVVDLWKSIFPLADEIVIAKIISVLPYFFLLLYGLIFVRKRFGIFVTGMSLFCIMSMPQLSAYMVEMRMYSFALFFVTVAFYHAYEIAMDTEFCRKHYIALTLYGLMAAYTQYFACVAVIVIYGYLFLWFGVRHWKSRDKVDSKALLRLFLCTVVSVLAYLPWFLVLLSQIATVRENYWIQPLTWRSLGGCVKFLMKPAFSNETVNVVLAVTLFGLYVGLLASYGFGLWYRKYKKREDLDREMLVRFWYTLAGCMVLCGLVGFGFFASALIRPIFVYRYMLPAMGCFWLCFALCLDALTDRWQNVSLQRAESLRQGNQLYRSAAPIFLTVLIMLVVLVIGIRDYRAFMGEEEYKIVNMQKTEDAITKLADDDILIYNFDQLQAVGGYYLEQDNYLWNGEAEQLIVEMFGNKGSIDSTKQIEGWLSSGRKVWFLGSFNSREELLAEWEQEGVYSEEKGSYLLERYWFNLYRIYN